MSLILYSISDSLGQMLSYEYWIWTITKMNNKKLVLTLKCVSLICSLPWDFFSYCFQLKKITTGLSIPVFWASVLSGGQIHWQTEKVSTTAWWKPIKRETWSFHKEWNDTLTGWKVSESWKDPPDTLQPEIFILKNVFERSTWLQLNSIFWK